MQAGRAVPFATRYGQLAPVIERVFDLPFILRASVGLRWAGAGARRSDPAAGCLPEPTPFPHMWRISTSYVGQRFVILPEQPRSVGEKVVVATQIVPVTGTPTRIDYVLRPGEAEGGVLWKAIDVMLDGSISQVALQRSRVLRLARRWRRREADRQPPVARQPISPVVR